MTNVALVPRVPASDVASREEELSMPDCGKAPIHWSKAVRAFASIRSAFLAALAVVVDC